MRRGDGNEEDAELFFSVGLTTKTHPHVAAGALFYINTDNNTSLYIQ